MRAVQRWVKAQGDDQDILCDFVPEHLAIEFFREKAQDESDKTLLGFCCEHIEVLKSSRKTESEIKRARTALRLGLAVAIHCRNVNESEVASIEELVVRNQKLLQTERRYMAGIGSIAHSRTFPFHSLPSGLERGLWRPLNHVSFRRKRIREDFTSFDQVFSRDVIVRVLTFCDTKTIGRAMLVSKEWTEAENRHSNLVWQFAAKSKWPTIVETDVNFKLRYQNRMKLARGRKVPFGKKALPPLVFCPLCDRLFSTPFHLKQHKCITARTANGSDTRRKHEYDII